MTDEQKAILLLWQRVNTSLLAFYKLTLAFNTASQALKATGEDWAQLSIHKKHTQRHNNTNEFQDNEFITAIEQRINAGEFQLLFKDNTHYPVQLSQLFDPPPVLFCQGDLLRLNQAQIAIVGSRKPTPQAQKFTFDMAQYLAQSGYIITSGLAQGVDAQAHLGALAQNTSPANEQSGRTIGVMGTGIDVCYPKQHHALLNRIVSEGGCIISELFPGTPPNKYTFPRRNRLVAGLSLGTIVTEAAIKSGSLITARLASEQGKQVFALPSSIDNPNAEGCHHLIREGATLIYHPDQVINEIASQIITPPMRSTTINQDALNNDSTLFGESQSFFNSSEDGVDGSDSQNRRNSKVKKEQTKLAGFIKPSNKKTASQCKKNSPNTVSNNSSPNNSALSNTTQNNLAKNIVVSEQLQPLWVHINWDGQDLDALIIKTQLDTPTLLSQLMQLELMGAITQVAGRYKRL